MRLKPQILGAAAALAGLMMSAAPARAEVTYAKDIAPLFQAHCQECHRPGEGVPMVLMSYKDARPWLKSIKKTVAEGQMPPWHADPAIGKWKNDRRLKPEEIEKLVSWIDSGAPMGDPADLPPALKFTEGWKNGTPDVVYEFDKEVALPADLVDDYIYVKMKTDLKEGRWLKGVECRPGNVDVVHHIIAFAKPAGAAMGSSEHSKERADEEKAAGQGSEKKLSKKQSRLGGMVALGGMAPGTAPTLLPDGEGIYLPANSEIVFQMHYHKDTGLEAKDRSKIGLIFCKKPVLKQKQSDAISNVMFSIPPNAENHEVKAMITVDEDIDLQSIMPHMHLRGTSMKVWAKYQDGREETLLNVPHYDFNWQTIYQPVDPIRIPAGTKLYALATYNNSASNPANPNPNEAVHFGEPTTAEMMFAFLQYTSVNESLNEMDPSAIRPSASAGGQ